MTRRAQPHGGALNTGNPGNKGGGRPPSLLREMARGITAEALPKLRLIAMGEHVTHSRAAGKSDEGETRYVDTEKRPEIREMLDAFDRLVALGLGEELRTEDVRKRLERQNEILAALLPPDLLGPVMQAIGEAWA